MCKASDYYYKADLLASTGSSAGWKFDSFTFSSFHTGRAGASQELFNSMHTAYYMFQIDVLASKYLYCRKL